MIYRDVKEKFENYTKEVSEKVEDTTSLNSMQQYTVSKLKMRNPSLTDDSVSLYKQDYKNRIKGKTDHIYRVTSGMEGMFKQLELGEDFIELSKVTGILHDVGRYEQYAQTSTFVDGDSYSKHPAFINYSNHAEHGADIIKENNYFGIPRGCDRIVYEAVKHHADAKLPKGLQKRMSENLFFGKSIEEIVSCGGENFELLASLYAQSIIDVDEFDLFNQILIGNIPIVRQDFGLDFLEGDTVEYFSQVWGISPDKLREYNKIPVGQQMKPNSIIRIPTELVPMENFQLSDEAISLFKEDKLPSLKELQARKDYSFLFAQVFRLSLLRKINFVSMLKDIKEKDVLQRILDMYPDKYKEIMNPIFKYANDELIDARINNGVSKLYTK